MKIYKITCHSINRVKKLKYRRREINKQHTPEVSGMYDIPNLSYSVKSTTENYVSVKSKLEHAPGHTRELGFDELSLPGDK